MSSSKIDIKVGLMGDQNPELYEQLTISFELHKDKLQKLNKSLEEISGSTSAPLVLIELPTMNFKDLQLARNDSIYEFREFTKNNRIYHMGNLKSTEHQKFVKSLDKTFSKLTELDNWAKFSISLYDSINIKKRQELWRKALIKGEAKIDNEFIGLFQDLVKKISPEFADSPIVVLLQLLQSMDLNLNVKKFDAPDGLKEIVHKYVGIDMSAESKLLEKMKETKEQATIRITVGHLFSIKIKGQSRALAAFLAHL